MYDLLFALFLAGGFSLALGVAYSLFCMFLFIVYKLSGGRLDIIAYLEKM